MGDDTVNGQSETGQDLPQTSTPQTSKPRTSKHRADGPPDGGVVEAIRVVAGSPDAVELAAGSAVLAAILREESRDQRQNPPVPSAWPRTGRLRRPLTPGPGQWTRFVP